MPNIHTGVYALMWLSDLTNISLDTNWPGQNFNWKCPSEFARELQALIVLPIGPQCEMLAKW